MRDDEYSLVGKPGKGAVHYLIPLDEFYAMSRSRDNKRSYWTLETFYSTLNTLNGRTNNSSSFLDDYPNTSSLIHQMDLSFIFVQIIEPSWKNMSITLLFPLVCPFILLNIIQEADFRASHKVGDLLRENPEAIMPSISICWEILLNHVIHQQYPSKTLSLSN